MHLSPEKYNAMRESGRITFDHNQPKIKIWQGWYRHIVIYLDGKEVGRMQEKKQSRRYDWHTSSGNAGVMGIDARWAVNWYLKSQEASNEN